MIMMVLSMSLLLTLFHNSTSFLSTHRFFFSSLSTQGSLHYWHLTIIMPTASDYHHHYQDFMEWHDCEVARTSPVYAYYLCHSKVFDDFRNIVSVFEMGITVILLHLLTFLYLLVALKYLENHSFFMYRLLQL